jgi:polysaccharide export outer membrane protein
MEMNRLILWLMTVLALTLVVATSNASAATDTLLGPGDVMKIFVYGNPDLNLETRVSEAGKITFPLIGEVIVGRLSASAAEKKIAGLLESGGFLRNPQVNVLVSLLQSQQVSVLGQVNRPGRYPLDGKRMLTDILALAGGANPDGSDMVTLIRQSDGKTSRQLIDTFQLFSTGDITLNEQLQNNDIIYVERAVRFYIYGEVQRPGVYRLERDMTVLQALSVSGGLNQRGTERGVRIKRRDANGNLEVIKVKHDDLIRPDDVVYIQESLF